MSLSGAKCSDNAAHKVFFSATLFRLSSARVSSFAAEMLRDKPKKVNPHLKNNSKRYLWKRKTNSRRAEWRSFRYDCRLSARDEIKNLFGYFAAQKRRWKHRQERPLPAADIADRKSCNNEDQEHEEESRPNSPRIKRVCIQATSRRKQQFIVLSWWMRCCWWFSIWPLRASQCNMLLRINIRELARVMRPRPAVTPNSIVYDDCRQLNSRRSPLIERDGQIWFGEWLFDYAEGV